MTESSAAAHDLCAFVDASPSPFHVCGTVAARLRAAGFAEVDETLAWPAEPGRHFLVRGGSLVAWSTESATGPASSFRVVGGHTDSPNLRVKQHHDRTSAGWETIALQPYGGAWLNSWLDRDLGLSGRVSVRDGDAVATRLVLLDEPVLTVPQLAIHLSEERKGVQLDPQRHLDAVYGTGDGSDLLSDVARRLEVARDDVLAFELMTHDLTASRLLGPRSDLLAAPRLDNQVTCWAGMQALLAAVEQPAAGVVPLLVLFDHEEVGSMSDRGAFSDLLTTVIERVVVAAGGGRDEYHRAIAGSVCASGDMAHATHPNYPDRHEPGHRIVANGGPVLKVHPNLRYATDATGTAAFALACEVAGVPLQRYEHRADLPCGSTVGPITASRTGMPTVDVGAPQLAMHAARELMGAHDPHQYAAALTAFLAPAA
ncbi:aspartyl aminopeptidase [Mumia flava]|uniref:M18 family aminopeptidase n=1 Tax=Mumia flava TaxID=1348852 RepID=A0A0B2BI32_9ACTN|nr:M18 family aminopeptidase [Mumia flava]PJJ55961.1 aspartyl aminopeptidase [Mumia flava]